MRKKMALALAASLAFSALPAATAYAYTKNRVTKVARVGKDTVLTTISAPVLVIQSSDDHVGDFEFELKLNNAKWSDEWSTEGVLADQEGITYYKMGDTRMKFVVDSTVFLANSKDIRIPLLTEMTGGDASVVIDGKSSAVSSEDITFANVGKGTVTFKTETLDAFPQSGILNDIIIDEQYYEQMRTGDRMRLKLSNGFVFTGEGNITGTGKFAGCVGYAVDASDASIAYVNITKATGTGSGAVVLNGVAVKPTDESQYGEIELTLNRDNAILTVKAANFGGEVDYNKPLVLNDTQSKSFTPKFSGTGGEGRIVIAEIASRNEEGKYVEYQEMGRTLIDKSGKWEISYPSTMKKLEEGVYGIKIGYYNPAHQVVAEAQEFEYFAYDVDIVKYTVGKTGYTINQEEFATDAAPYIDENGNTMLPLRAVANSMGIKDDDIVWDDGTITIKNGDQTITIKLGEKELKVRSKRVAIPSPAVMKDDRTYLPLRSILNALGVINSDIAWDEEAKTVTVYK